MVEEGDPRSSRTTMRHEVLRNLGKGCRAKIGAAVWAQQKESNRQSDGCPKNTDTGEEKRPTHAVA
jgi:hypothetical protein